MIVKCEISCFSSPSTALSHPPCYKKCPFQRTFILLPVLVFEHVLTLILVLAVMLVLMLTFVLVFRTSCFVHVDTLMIMLLIQHELSYRACACAYTYMFVGGHSRTHKYVFVHVNAVY